MGFRPKITLDDCRTLINLDMAGAASRATRERT
jgi:hypothetical protein